jgi:hypothetical protein
MRLAEEVEAKFYHRMAAITARLTPAQRTRLAALATRLLHDGDAHDHNDDDHGDRRPPAATRQSPPAGSGRRSRPEVG